MNIQKIEELTSNLKNEFDVYLAKKSYKARRNVREILQQIKVQAQEIRKWILEDFKNK